MHFAFHGRRQTLGEFVCGCFDFHDMGMICIMRLIPTLALRLDKLTISLLGFFGDRLALLREK